ncbi:methylenetetrahydrofolate reductase [Intrasporangium sp.]|uniref:methylenetetrahydrofolate reductase n=1 Tax=Intrasporangium sp. TaxID=1925024 RepID=UPI00293A0702|nr:methylenetetrahydrofolate reductase [Intrasporangium sp.]MDV3221174.1 methylenetetrahydrofolate reductase [Intrasporangium sp.]
MNRQEHLRRLVANIGFEVMPFKDIEHKAVDLVDPSVPLTVTTTAAKGLDRTLDVAIHLRERGFDVAPHLAARLFRDDQHTAEVVQHLVANGVERVFVIGGDGPEPEGKFFDALALLESIARTGHRFREVGIGGYPEGHPNFSTDVAEKALVEKSLHADRVITQMCFDPKVTTAWAGDMARAGAHLTFYAGMPGPVNRQKLIRISASLGLGTSARFLQKQKGLWRFLMPGAYNPSKLLRGLAAAQPESEPLVHGIHLFTFNELAGAEKWRLKLRRETGLD